MTKYCIKKPIATLSAIILICCSASYKIIKNEPVKNIPDKKYETIIRLNTPENEPLKSEAGFVYIEPREEFVKNLDMLDKYARLNRNNMSKFVIKDSKGKVRGYFEMLAEYTVIIWERGDDILLQVIIPNIMGENSGEAGDGRRSGGKHGGK